MFNYSIFTASIIMLPKYSNSPSPEPKRCQNLKIYGDMEKVQK